MTPKVREAIEKGPIRGDDLDETPKEFATRIALLTALEAARICDDLQARRDNDWRHNRFTDSSPAACATLIRALRGAQNAEGRNGGQDACSTLPSSPADERCATSAPAPAAPDPETIKWAQEIVAAYDAHCGPYTVKCGTVAHEFLRLHADAGCCKETMVA